MKRFIIALMILALTATSCNPTTSKITQTTQNDTNPVIETIMSRRSIRAYKDQAVPREILQQIAECGINAPNGMNAQQWEVRIVDNAEWIASATKSYVESVKGTPSEKMVSGEGFKNMFRNAPAVIFIAHKPGRCTQVDCGLMAGNMVLAAKSLGLGTCCMMGPLGFFSTPEGKEFLSSMNLSEGYELLLSVGVGYPDEEPAAKPRNKEVIKFVE
jgi:nitroreductase